MGAVTVADADKPGQAWPDEGPAASGQRVLPFSEVAEQSLLGSLLLDNACWPDVSQLVDSSMFYVHAHRLVFGVLAELLQQGAVADMVTVYQVLADRGQAEDAGGLQYLATMQASVPGARGAARYAHVVAEKAAERALIAGLYEATHLAWDAAQPLDERVARLADLVRRVDQSRIGASARGVPFLPLDGLRQSAEAVEWLVKRTVPADSIGMLFGGSGTFKTYLALDMALHICHGLRWLGKRTRQGPVIYIAAEGGAGLWARIQAWHHARGLDWRKAPLYVVPVALDLAQDAWRVVDAAQGAGVTPQLVVVDTLSQTYAGEENSANEMAAYLRALGTRFRALWRCAVMVVHHSGHSSTERPRGSSAIRANVDFLLGAFRDENEMLVTLNCVKQKDGELFPDVSFRMQVQRLGEDEDGEDITQLYATHLDTPEALCEAMAHESKAGRGGQNQLLLGLLQNGMTVEELRKAFYEDCGLDKVDSKKKAYHRALAWAKNSGFVELAQGVVIVRRAQK